MAPQNYLQQIYRDSIRTGGFTCLSLADHAQHIMP